MPNILYLSRFFMRFLASTVLVGFIGFLTIPVYNLSVAQVATPTETNETKDLTIKPIEKLQSLAKKGKGWALIIGIEDYQDPSITDLKYSIDDAKTLYEVLIDPKRGSYSPQNVRLLTDDASDPKLKPTRVNILDSLTNWLTAAESEDTVFFYFSGHGIVDKNGKNYLVSIDAMLNLLEDTAVSMERVNQILDDREKIRAKQVVVMLDSCHSGAKVGAKGDAENGKVLDPLFSQAEGRSTLASCGPDEQSFEDTQKGHGVFTYYLVEGLKGEADQASNKDGWITVTELNDYVFRSVQEWARTHQGRKQTPRRQENIAGQIVVGRNPQVPTPEERHKQADFNESRQRLLNLVGEGEDKLALDEATAAIKLLERELKGEALSEQEREWTELVKGLSKGEVKVKYYRRLTSALEATSAVKDEPKPPIQSVQSTQPARGYGNLVVDSTPWSEIYLDGEYKGQTPFQVKNIIAGKHELKLRNPKFLEVVRTIEIKANDTLKLKIPLGK